MPKRKQSSPKHLIDGTLPVTAVAHIDSPHISPGPSRTASPTLKDDVNTDTGADDSSTATVSSSTQAGAANSTSSSNSATESCSRSASHPKLLTSLISKLLDHTSANQTGNADLIDLVKTELKNFVDPTSPDDGLSKIAGDSILQDNLSQLDCPKSLNSILNRLLQKNLTQLNIVEVSPDNSTVSVSNKNDCFLSNDHDSSSQTSFTSARTCCAPKSLTNDPSTAFTTDTATELRKELADCDLVSQVFSAIQRENSIYLPELSMEKSKDIIKHHPNLISALTNDNAVNDSYSHSVISNPRNKNLSKLLSYLSSTRTQSSDAETDSCSLASQPSVVVDDCIVKNSSLDTSDLASVCKNDLNDAAVSILPKRDTPDQSLDCLFCRTVCKSYYLLRRHIRREHVNRRAFSCGICKKDFFYRRALRCHQYSQHNLDFSGTTVKGSQFLNKNSSQNKHHCMSRFYESEPNQALSVSKNDEPIHDDGSQSSPTDSLSTRTCDDMERIVSCLRNDGLSRDDAVLNLSLNCHSKASALTPLDPMCEVLDLTVDSKSPRDLSGNHLSIGSNNSCLTTAIHEGAWKCCPCCSKAFSKPCDLKRHMMMHTGERPFSCHLCNRAFRAKSSMQYHQKARHGLNVELSRGLEQRYRRLKRRAYLAYLNNRTYLPLSSGPLLISPDLIRDSDGGLERCCDAGLSSAINNGDESVNTSAENGSVSDHPPLSILKIATGCDATMESTSAARDSPEVSMSGEVSLEYHNEQTDEKFTGCQKLEPEGRLSSRTLGLSESSTRCLGGQPPDGGNISEQKGTVKSETSQNNEEAIENKASMDDQVSSTTGSSLSNFYNKVNDLHVDNEVSYFETPRSKPDDINAIGRIKLAKCYRIGENCKGARSAVLGENSQVTSEMVGKGLKMPCSTVSALHGDGHIEETNKGAVSENDSMVFENRHITVVNEISLAKTITGLDKETGEVIKFYRCGICDKIDKTMDEICCHLSKHCTDSVVYPCPLCSKSFVVVLDLIHHYTTHLVVSDEPLLGEVSIGHKMDGVVTNDLNSRSSEVCAVKKEGPTVDDHTAGDYGKFHEESNSVTSDSRGLRRSRRICAKASLVQRDKNRKSRLSVVENCQQNHENHCSQEAGKYRWKVAKNSPSCDICGSTFPRRNSLTRHVKIHGGNIHFRCNQCGKVFRERRNLRLHVLRLHHIAPPLDATKKARRLMLLSRLRKITKMRSSPLSENSKNMNSQKSFAGKVKSPINTSMGNKIVPTEENRNVDVIEINSSDEDMKEKLCDVKQDDDCHPNVIANCPLKHLKVFSKNEKSRRKSSMPMRIKSGGTPSLLEQQLLTPVDSLIYAPANESSTITCPTAGTSPPENQVGVGVKESPTDRFEKDSKNIEQPIANVKAEDCESSNVVLSDSSSTMTLQTILQLIGSNKPTTELGNQRIDFLQNQPLINFNQQHVLALSSAPSTFLSATNLPMPLSIISPSVANSSTIQQNIINFPNGKWEVVPKYNISDAIASSPEYGLSSDGKKVTSLSRTHSRLIQIKQPIDRVQACQQITSPEGFIRYKCGICSKMFNTNSDIHRHMDFHEDIRPYKCDFCDYMARTNSQLKVHMLRHQGIRLYCCKVCKYKGVTQSDLNRHMKSQIHTLKTRNACGHCGEGFVSTRSLVKHTQKQRCRLNAAAAAPGNDHDR